MLVCAENEDVAVNEEIKLDDSSELLSDTDPIAEDNVGSDGPEVKDDRDASDVLVTTGIPVESVNTSETDDSDD